MATSTLGYGLLGLLARDDLTGYDLSLRMREPTAYYWYARHGQIYPELAKLERAGLVRHTKVRQTERPDKKVFAITPKGRMAVKRWIAAPMPARRPRDELTLRMYSLWLADPAAAAAMLTAELEKHVALVTHYRKVRKETRAAPRAARGKPDARFSDLVTVERGVGYERETTRWLRWLIAELQRGSSS